MVARLNISYQIEVKNIPLKFEQFCEDEGVHHQLIIAYTHKQNGVSKRRNRTITEMA